MNQEEVTIVVPTLNEVGNVEPLVKRIDAAMTQNHLSYRVLFIDDFSTDGTAEKIESLITQFPIALEFKKGYRGKAQSVMQGFSSARTPYVAMIDADLQYPPEAIPAMLQQLTDGGADVSLSNRHDSNAGRLRNAMSKVFNFIFVRSLFGINYDTQSGLKVFRKRVYNGMKLRPSQWSFDLEFIVAALMKRSKISTYDIRFSERKSGEAKINVIKSSIELAKSSILLRMRVPGRIIREAYHANLTAHNRLSGAK